MNTNTLVISGTSIAPGERKIVNIPIGSTYDFTEMTISAQIISGKLNGPTLFISAAIHGDELNGVEIIKRITRHRALRQIRGTLIAVPIVNVFGFNSQSRYLPDRRDLNRNFPGNSIGSPASRMAHIFVEEIVKKSTHGIDLHTGAIHRSNLPQVRAYIDDPAINQLAHDFGVPVIINSAIRDGSLREAARELGVPMLLYEGGQALRLNEDAIKAGTRGVLSVMANLGMIDPKYTYKRKTESFIARSSYWVRAPESGMIRMTKKLGQHANENQTLGVISDPFGSNRISVKCKDEGIIIGQNNLPLVSRGDALTHIACFKDLNDVKDHLEAFDDFLVTSNPLD